MSTQRAGYRVVLAVFSGTDFNETVFQKALDIAREEEATLWLAGVRDEECVEQLAEGLAQRSLLGRGAIERIAVEVNAERGHAVERVLDALADKARMSGVQALWCAAQGGLVATTHLIAEQREADVIVLSKDHALHLVGAEAAVIGV